MDMEQRYKLVTKAYLGKGKDGYDSLAKAEVNFHSMQSGQKYPEKNILTQISWHKNPDKISLHKDKYKCRDKNVLTQIS